MFLKNLQLRQFKSHSDRNLNFVSGINCFLGNNGVGKTNILEAIHFICLTKSSRNITDSQCIQHDKDFFYIKGQIEYTNLDQLLETEIVCQLKKGGKKQVLVDDKSTGKLKSHIGKYPLVMMEPEDTDLIREGGEERRRFFDGMISQMDKNYLESLIKYNKILQQRNAYLKRLEENTPKDFTQLTTYNSFLCPLGEEISKKRTEFLSEYNPIFLKHYQKLTDNIEKASITYLPSFEIGHFEETLLASQKKDLILQRTNIGIQKDDFIFHLNENEIKKFGSQGQQKSFVIALKLAQFEILEQKSSKKPLLMLDDIFDKLDDHRIGKLVEMIKNDFGQVFITDARPERTKGLLQEIKQEIKFFDLS